jgi:DNA-binding transcriptional MocR family regulator
MGNADLRRQIALRYQLDGVPVSSDDIVITKWRAGSAEPVPASRHAARRHGADRVAQLLRLPAGAAAAGTQGRRDRHQPRDGVDLAALEELLLRHRPKACWLMTNFQNPWAA